MTLESLQEKAKLFILCVCKPSLVPKGLGTRLMQTTPINDAHVQVATSTLRTNLYLILMFAFTTVLHCVYSC